MKKIVEVLADKVSLIERSQVLVVDKIQSAIASRGQCSIALAGGSTPKPLYEALAQENLPWDKIHIFWGDERYVAPNHPDSNQLMARQAWLDKIEIAETNIHPIPTEANNPEIDAQSYEAELRKVFAASPEEFPTFDIILLGMGDDGHTASLFPHTSVLNEAKKAIAVGNKDGQPRITFTVPLLNQARCVLFLVAGANKQAALEQVFAAQGDAMTYPSRLINPQGELWWLLDRNAGAKINVPISC
ncbi:MAG: 6-phosphogluconolactonase [Xenococcus sp. MO_188.B8]|nr:6-phosphogluconolactonase [Xenococcus sp. MO_188.B8]